MRFLRAVPAIALVACSLGTAPTAPEGSLKVLFIGNSLTYQNDLPRTVADLALSAGLAALLLLPDRVSQLRARGSLGQS